MRILFWIFAVGSGLALGGALLCLWFSRDFLFDPHRDKRKGWVFLSFHAADLAFAEHIAALLEAQGIDSYRYEPGGFAHAPLVDRDADNYEENETYYAAIRGDPRSTAIFYYRGFANASCLLLLNPRRIDENSAFVEAEIDIAHSLLLTIYPVDTPEQLAARLPQIAAERVPWFSQADSQLFMKKLGHHLENLYRNDPTLDSAEVDKELRSLFDRGGFMVFDTLDRMDRQILPGCFGIQLLLISLFCAVIAGLIHWLWL